jgi:predicted DNA binding CopG/RHH family protein
MNEKEIRKMQMNEEEKETMKAIWFPKEWHKVIKERAEEEGYPIYKYIMMLSNNKNIFNEKSN